MVRRRSRSRATARDTLMSKFSLTQAQADAILDMRLHQLTGLEREKLEEEYKELQQRISYLREVLANESMLMGIIKDELLAIREKYSDPRRTRIAPEEQDIDIEDLIAEEEIVVTVTHRGYIKRMPLSAYRSQKRGGKGITGLTTREDDFVEHLFVATTHHQLMFFTNRGKVYRLKGYEIPEAGRTARGTAVVNLLPLSQGEFINTIIPVGDFSQDGYLFMATRQGVVKKTELSQFTTSRKEGLIAISLDENDELIGVKLTDGNQEIILGTREGLAIRFPEEQVRPMGRSARGVKGISLEPGDAVVGMDIAREGADLLVLTENGYGKRTGLEEYRSQARGGKGILNIKMSKRNGKVIGISVVQPGEELMIISSDGIIIRLDVNDISRTGRVTQGVTLMRLENDQRVVAMAKVVMRDEGLNGGD